MSLHPNRTPLSNGSPDPPAPLHPGDVIDEKFRIECTLGVGGMGIVYGALHLGLDERVAVKVLVPELASNADVVARFAREGRAAIKIRGEHVVRVFDVGTLPSGLPYLVMERLEGRDLEALVKEDGPLNPHVAIDFVLQACEALAEAHGQGMVHRDLKPANLFVIARPDGSPCVKVLDFGISKLRSMPKEPGSLGITSSQSIMGSPQYMSPEQLTATRDVDARADIWSMGAILYELLCGLPPFRGTSVPAICATILKDPPPRVSETRAVPDGIDEVVFKCLSRDPRDRYSNVSELAQALAPLGSERATEGAERITRILRGSSPAISGEGGILVRKPRTEIAWGSARSVRRHHAPIWGWVAALLLLCGVSAFGAARIAMMSPARTARPAQTMVASHLPESTSEIEPLPPPLPIVPVNQVTLTSAAIEKADGGGSVATSARTVVESPKRVTRRETNAPSDEALFEDRK